MRNTTKDGHPVARENADGGDRNVDEGWLIGRAPKIGKWVSEKRGRKEAEKIGQVSALLADSKKARTTCGQDASEFDVLA